ncbi:Glutathione S-transferase 1, isoform C [Halotydeus destructor]|nr:Glutathione S-transferase 1, isoform C [Halotydeus destructor]
MAASEPCRAVIMTARQLGVKLNLKELDLLNLEHLKPELIAINPQHCVPTLHDTESGLTLWESRAICAYLINKYAPGHSLYPDCPVKRAKVDQMLYFDSGSLYRALEEVIYPPLFCGMEVDENKKQLFRDKLKLLNGFLDGSNYVAGDNLTIADLSISASVCVLTTVDYDLTAYPNIVAYLELLGQELPYFKEVNIEPMRAFREKLEARLAASQ